jgi:hypothetical protein
MSSSPRFWNLATLASVPASVMVFVNTLCAERLYSGTMRRAPEAVEEREVIEPDDEMDEYSETSERFERALETRSNGAPPAKLETLAFSGGEPGKVDGRASFSEMERRPERSRSRELGGTSWS